MSPIESHRLRCSEMTSRRSHVVCFHDPDAARVWLCQPLKSVALALAVAHVTRTHVMKDTLHRGTCSGEG